MHSPFYGGQFDSGFTVRSTILFRFARKGVLEFYVNKYEEAAKSGADGVTVVVCADDREIARCYENPYNFPDEKHNVALTFDIPPDIKNISILIEANGNPGWDHTYIEKLDVREINVFGWIISIFAIILFFYNMPLIITLTKLPYLPQIKQKSLADLFVFVFCGLIGTIFFINLFGTTILPLSIGLWQKDTIFRNIISGGVCFVIPAGIFQLD